MSLLLLFHGAGSAAVVLVALTELGATYVPNQELTATSVSSDEIVATNVPSRELTGTVDLE